MSRDIFLACRKLDIELIVNWESREAEVMTMADAGSRGPWLTQDEFQMDFATYAYILSRYMLILYLTLLSKYLNLDSVMRVGCQVVK